MSEAGGAPGAADMAESWRRVMERGQAAAQAIARRRAGGGDGGGADPDPLTSSSRRAPGAGGLKAITPAPGAYVRERAAGAKE